MMYAKLTRLRIRKELFVHASGLTTLKRLSALIMYFH